jgi:hypothetical protein
MFKESKKIGSNAMLAECGFIGGVLVTAKTWNPLIMVCNKTETRDARVTTFLGIVYPA